MEVLSAANEAGKDFDVVLLASQEGQYEAGDFDACFEDPAEDDGADPELLKIIAERKQAAETH